MFIVIVVIILLILAVVAMYNGLVRSRNSVKNAWSQINVQLQRRFDLIPNLVETCKAYMKHEEETLTKVTELRTSWGSASSVSEKAALDKELTGQLSRLIAVAENYPDLKANTSFTEVMEELRNTENKVAYSRQAYNDTVTRYNTQLETIPTNIIAGMFNFKPEELFETTSEEVKEAVKVNFDK